MIHKLEKFENFKNTIVTLNTFTENAQPFQLKLDNNFNINTEYRTYSLIYDSDRYVDIKWHSIPLNNSKINNNLEKVAQETYHAITKATKNNFWNWRGIMLSKPITKIQNNFFKRLKSHFNSSNLWTENQRSDFYIFLFKQKNL